MLRSSSGLLVDRSPVAVDSLGTQRGGQSPHTPFSPTNAAGSTGAWFASDSAPNQERPRAPDLAYFRHRDNSDAQDAEDGQGYSGRTWNSFTFKRVLKKLPSKLTASTQVCPEESEALYGDTNLAVQDVSDGEKEDAAESSALNDGENV